MDQPRANLLRHATPDDTRRIFGWRNDPWIVSLSTGRRTVTFEEHQEWMRKILGSAQHLLFVIEPEAGSGAGTVRVERRDNRQAVITIYLLREFTGRGLGVRAIRTACVEALVRWPIESIRACIRRDNRPSLSAFAKAGFAMVDPSPGCPDDHCEMIAHRTSFDASSMLPLEATGQSTAASAYAARMREHYRPRLQQHGPTYQAVDWGSAQSQALRFRVLLQVGDVVSASLLDVGCGVGHLVDQLKTIGFRGKYLGFDLVPEMVQMARARHPDWEFQAGDLLSADDGLVADYVVGSGLFTFADRDRLERTVRRMFQQCLAGVAFNSLSARAGEKQPGEFYADPEATLEFCRQLTPWVVLRHDYLPHDFTVFLYRRQPAP